MTLMYEKAGEVVTVFQFLIGKIMTNFQLVDMNCMKEVSIPHR